jgi:hypothetical protein
MRTLLGKDTKPDSKLFQCSEVQWIFSQYRYSLAFSFVSFLLAMQKKRKEDEEGIGSNRLRSPATTGNNSAL